MKNLKLPAQICSSVLPSLKKRVVAKAVSLAFVTLSGISQHKNSFFV